MDFKNRSALHFASTAESVQAQSASPWHVTFIHQGLAHLEGMLDHGMLQIRFEPPEHCSRAGHCHTISVLRSLYGDQVLSLTHLHQS